MTTKNSLVLKKHGYTILFLGWVLFVTILSLFSFSGIEDEGLEIPHIDKITHFIFYFFFVVFGYFFLVEKSRREILSLTTILKLVAVGICYGALMETLQWLMPYNRMAEIWDALANATGAILGGLLIKMYISLTHRSK